MCNRGFGAEEFRKEGRKKGKKEGCVYSLSEREGYVTDRMGEGNTPRSLTCRAAARSSR